MCVNTTNMPTLLKSTAHISTICVSKSFPNLKLPDCTRFPWQSTLLKVKWRRGVLPNSGPPVSAVWSPLPGGSVVKSWPLHAENLMICDWRWHQFPVVLSNPTELQPNISLQSLRQRPSLTGEAASPGGLLAVSWAGICLVPLPPHMLPRYCCCLQRQMLWAPSFSCFLKGTSHLQQSSNNCGWDHRQQHPLWKYACQSYWNRSPARTETLNLLRDSMTTLSSLLWPPSSLAQSQSVFMESKMPSWPF